VNLPVATRGVRSTRPGGVTFARRKAEAGSGGPILPILSEIVNSEWFSEKKNQYNCDLKNKT